MYSIVINYEFSTIDMIKYHIITQQNILQKINLMYSPLSSDEITQRIESKPLKNANNRSLAIADQYTSNQFQISQRFTNIQGQEQLNTLVQKTHQKQKQKQLKAFVQPLKHYQQASYNTVKIDLNASKTQQKEQKQKLQANLSILIGLVVALSSFYLFFIIAKCELKLKNHKVQIPQFNRVKSNSLMQINLSFWIGLAIVIFSFIMQKIISISKSIQPHKNIQSNHQKNIQNNKEKDIQNNNQKSIQNNDQITIIQRILSFNQILRLTTLLKCIYSYICMVIVIELLFMNIIQSMGYSKTFYQFKTIQQFKVGYIWENAIPMNHQKMLDSIHNYQFRVVRNCTMLLNQHVELPNLQFLNSDILNIVNIKTDLCKFVYLYEYGGLYLDMDAQVDYQCMKKFVSNMKPNQIFFEATPQNTIDIFAIYTSQAKNPLWKMAINTFISLNSYSPYFTISTNNIPKSYKRVVHSNCIKHKQQRTWQKINKT